MLCCAVAPPASLCQPPALQPCRRSPHVRSLSERVAVGGVPISDADFDGLAAPHAGAVEAAQAREGGALSHFEILTALAFKHFQEQQVVIAGRRGGAAHAAQAGGQHAYTVVRCCAAQLVPPLAAQAPSQPCHALCRWM